MFNGQLFCKCVLFGSEYKELIYHKIMQMCSLKTHFFPENKNKNKEPAFPHQKTSSPFEAGMIIAQNIFPALGDMFPGPEVGSHFDHLPKFGGTF